MKKLIIIILLFPISMIGQNKKQYLELNIGLATGLSYMDACPGASFLYGETIDLGNKWLVDYQIGIAAPSIITSRVGFGSYFNKNKSASFIIGCRPWPLTGYTQLSFGKAQNFILTGELGTGGDISMDAVGIFTFGYRWVIDREKE